MLEKKPAICQLLKHENSSSIICFSQHRFNYKEFITLVKKASNFLKKQGIVSHDRVILGGHRDLMQVIFMLACHMLRASYVPIQPDCNFEEVNNILKLTKAKCHMNNNSELPMAKRYPTFELLNKEVEYDVIPETQLDDEAYIILTSGTTGKPKAVSITQKNLAVVLSSSAKHIQLQQIDVLSAIHSFCFDFSVWELWFAFVSGAGLYIAADEELVNLEYLLFSLNEQRVTLLSATPSVFYNLGLLQEIKKHNFTYLENVVFGGETLRRFHFELWYKVKPDLKFHNLYGATETTIHATYLCVHPQTFNDKHGSPIGKPLASYEVKVVDHELKEVSTDVRGEMLISGPAVITQYLNNDYPEKFVFLHSGGTDESNSKCYYKTGDYVNYDYDGNLYFHYRTNDHAKIRGFRIDIGAVQEEMNKIKSINSSYVGLCSIGNEDSLVCLFKTNNFYFDAVVRFQPSKKLVTLPTGIQIAENNSSETAYLFDEIFNHNHYWHPEVRLPENPVVIDVGANIGLFAVALKLCYPQAIIHCIEPVPLSYETLSINAEIFGPNIIAHKIALGDSCQEIEITAYKDMTIMSGADVDYKENLRWLVSHAKTQLSEETNHFLGSELQEALSVKLSSYKVSALQYSLSKFIENNNLSRIDFLKIDVESSELKVLQGITDNYWSLIANIVIEINLNRVSIKDCCEILERQGFQTQMIQQDDMRELGLCHLWGWRSSQLPFMNKVCNIDYRYFQLPVYISNIKEELARTLPFYAIPSQFVICHQFPTNKNGKLDLRAIFNLQQVVNNKNDTSLSRQNELRGKLEKAFSETLGINLIKITGKESFFDLGANSLLVIKFYHSIVTSLPECAHLKLIDLFTYPSFDKLVNFIHGSAAIKIDNREDTISISGKIAIIGMAGCFSESSNHHEVWQHLLNGDCLTKHYNAEELSQFNVNLNKSSRPRFVPSSALIENCFEFDADFFNYMKRDAIFLDPQQRICLQQIYQAFLDAGYSPRNVPDKVGVFLGQGRSNYERYLLASKHVDHVADDFTIEILNEKDYLATRAAYHFGFTGPVLNINNACATSTAAIITACNYLRLGLCDMAIAGGVYIKLPNDCGYIAKEHSTFSPTGVCSPFSSNADGIVPGSGCGVFLLKNLEKAIADGDDIKAVISGYAMNNDGGDRAAFSALSFSGQVRCMEDALKSAGLGSNDIDYLETHGTATKMGDDLERQAIATVFSERKSPLYLGASKANYGHTDAASGALSIIKIIHMLNKNTIPPQIHYNKKENISDKNSSFEFKTVSEQPEHLLTHCAVNNFGLGGTNCQIILSRHEPTATAPLIDVPKFNMLAIAAHTPEVLMDYARQFLKRLETLSPLNSVDWFKIAWLSKENNLDLSYRAVIIADCCINAILQLNAMLISERGGVYALEAAPKELVASAFAWVEKRENTIKIFENITGQRMALPYYPFKNDYYHFDSLVTQFNIEPIDNNTLDLLLLIIRNVTQNHLLTAEESYFDAGMDSLGVLDVITEVNDKLGVKLTLDDCYAYPTVKSLHQYKIDKKAMPQTTIYPVNSSKALGRLVPLNNKQSDIQILFIPPTNGMLYCYQGLVEQLAERAFGIQFDNTDPQRDYTSIRQFALHYSDLLLQHLPVQKTVLIGWSFGGNVAYEMALVLKELDYPVEQLIMLDSFAHYELTDDEDKYKFNYYNQDVTRNKSKDSWECIWKRSQLLCAPYQPKKNASVSAILVRAEQVLPEYQKISSTDNLWSSVKADNLTVLNFAATHISMLSRENSLLLASMIKPFMS